jgi:hypothetical protein
VACRGTNALLRKRSLRRVPVRVVIGEPVRIAQGPASRRAVEDASEQIRVALAELARSLPDTQDRAG